VVDVGDDREIADVVDGKGHRAFELRIAPPAAPGRVARLIAGAGGRGKRGLEFVNFVRYAPAGWS
jgi:hypothetical protein